MTLTVCVSPFSVCCTSSWPLGLMAATIMMTADCDGLDEDDATCSCLLLS